MKAKTHTSLFPQESTVNKLYHEQKLLFILGKNKEESYERMVKQGAIRGYSTPLAAMFGKTKNDGSLMGVDLKKFALENPKIIESSTRNMGGIISVELLLIPYGGNFVGLSLDEIVTPVQLQEKHDLIRPAQLKMASMSLNGRAESALNTYLREGVRYAQEKGFVYQKPLTPMKKRSVNKSPLAYAPI